MLLKRLSLLVCFTALYFSAFATEKADIIVAADGSGKYKTIMEAIKSIPANNSKNVTILIKNGTYNEHVFIDKSFISLIGEDRTKTIIQFSINRDEWGSSHNGKLSGSGVIDIGVSSSDQTSTLSVSDIVIGNCTVQNTITNTGVKTHVIRGESGCNKIYVVNCNIWCKGHDTIALWNITNGMYYHADCSFKGSIDAVCPRGYCYTVGCDFFEVTSSAPLWHETAAGSTQKFVIRKGNFYADAGNSSNFKLLNANNSSSLGTRFYLLDCFISNKVTTKGNATEAYFFNCKGETGNQSWYANNLTSAPAKPSQNAITASWAFDNKWDPENAMPQVMPAAALPQPWDSAYDVPANVVLKWISGRNAEKVDLYLGKTNPPPFVKTQTERLNSPGNLSAGTYYWQVNSIDGSDTVKGSVWTFIVNGSMSIKSMTKSKTTFLNHCRILHNNGLTRFQLDNLTNEYTSFSLYTVQGKLVFSQSLDKKISSIGIPYCQLSKGTYFIRLTSSSTQTQSKITIP